MNRIISQEHRKFHVSRFCPSCRHRIRRRMPLAEAFGPWQCVKCNCEFLPNSASINDLPRALEDGTAIDYRPLPGFSGYMVGTDGSVWSSRRRLGRWKRLRTFPDKDGYQVVSPVSEDGVARPLKVHRLVLTTFVGPCPEGMESCHDPDPTRTNNRLSNLRWGTTHSNHADKTKHNTVARGESVATAKLDAASVLRIRALIESGNSISSIARLFNVARKTIRLIREGRTWRHV